MSTRKSWSLLSVALILALLAPGVGAGAQSVKILHSFNGQAGGGTPDTGVLFDSTKNNLYGATIGGGSFKNNCQLYFGCGVVYKLSQIAPGSWQEDDVFAFANAATGASPIGNLLLDSAGNLWGVAGSGGNSPECVGAVQGCGLVFEMSPTSTGGFQETVLADFTFSQGVWPSAGLVADAAGNLYGTLNQGGNSYCHGSGCGLVFELSPNGSGGWQESVLYSFTGGRDGSFPASTLLFDGAGNLYGTTTSGGNRTGCSNQGCGVVFELSPTPSGPWTETVLHPFSGNSDGARPLAGLVFDGSGNLYGDTYYGGNLNDCGGNGCGVVFRLAPKPTGGWQETVLYTFTGGADGAFPAASLIIEGTDTLEGTASAGGSYTGSNCSSFGCGLVFKLARASGGVWKETVLHTFSGGNDGSVPVAPLTLDGSGNLYSTAETGGAHGAGVVFEIIR